MNVPSDWWRTCFSGVFVDLWLGAVPEEVTRQEVELIQKLLQVPAHGRVLDVPCGGGRHALELAARGYAVTGVDTSPDFLTAARSESQRRGLEVTWEQRDMRDLPWPATFDGAICFGNSFGYLDDQGNADFLRAVARALKPGAHFLIDTGLCAESILPSLQPRRWAEVGRFLFLQQNEYDPVTARYSSDMTIIHDGQTDRRAYSQRVYTYSELCRLLDEVGFTDMIGYGSAALEPYRLGSPKLLLLATRARTAAAR